MPNYYEDVLKNYSYGINDTQSFRSSRETGGRNGGKRPDWQGLEESKLEIELQQAYSAGLISQDDHDEAMAYDPGDRRNWFQKALFDGPTHVAGMLGADVYDKSGELYNEGRKSSGSVLETIGDVLSLGNYASAAITSATLDDPGATLNVTGDENGWVVDLPFVGPLSFGVMNVGFSPSAFFRAWNSRTDYMQFADKHSLFGDSFGANFAGGLVMDIGLDPTTYLTFGVAAGMKSAVTPVMKGGARKGSRLAAYEGAELTTTRLGKQMYDLSAQQVKSRDLPDMISAGGSAAGSMRAKHLLTDVDSVKLHQRITENMVDNFDELSLELLRRQREGKLRRMGHLLGPAGEANRSMLKHAAALTGKALGDTAEESIRKGLAFTADDMFQETAGLMGKEVGLYSIERAQRTLSGLPGGYGRKMEVPFLNTGAKWVFNRFDKGWDAPKELVEMERLTGYLIRKQLDDSLVRYGEAFAGITDADDLETIAKVVEARAIHADFGEATLSVAGRYNDDIERAARFVEQEMADILAIENAVGYGTMTTRGYLTHILGQDPRALNIGEKVVFKNGEVSMDTANRFTQSRLIASIADGEDVYGKGALMTNAFDILRIRKRASVEMIERSTFNGWVVDNHGAVELLIRNAKDGMSNGLLRGLMRRAGHGSQDILNIDQVYKSEVGRLKELGFKEGEEDFNIDMLSYLMRENTEAVGKNGLPGKYSEEGLAHAERVGANEAARMHAVESRGVEEIIPGSQATVDIIHTSPVPHNFKFRTRQSRFPKTSADSKNPLIQRVRAKAAAKETVPQGGRELVESESIEFSVLDSLKMLKDPNHPGWDSILGIRQFSSPQDGNAINWMRGLNDFLVKNLDSQIAGYIPDVEERIIKAWKAGTERAGKTVSNEALDNFRLLVSSEIAGMSAPLTVSKVTPQLPAVLMQLVHATMEQVGVVTHLLPMHKSTSDHLYASASRLGFEHNTLNQLIKHAFNKDKVSEIVEQEAQILQDMFNTLIDNKALMKSMGKDGRTVSGAAELMRFSRSDPTVKRTVTFTRKVGDNRFVAEVFDQNLALPAHGATDEALDVAKEAGADLSGKEGLQVTEADTFATGTTRKAPDLSKHTKLIDKAEERVVKKKASLDKLRATAASTDEVSRSSQLSVWKKTLSRFRTAKKKITDANRADTIATLKQLREDGLVQIGPLTTLVNKMGKQGIGLFFDTYQNNVRALNKALQAGKMNKVEYAKATEDMILDFLGEHKLDRIISKYSAQAKKAVDSEWRRTLGHKGKTNKGRRVTYETIAQDSKKLESKVKVAERELRKTEKARNVRLRDKVAADESLPPKSGGGVVPSHTNVVDNVTKADALRMARKEFADASQSKVSDYVDGIEGKHRAINEAQERINLARDGMIDWTVEGSPAARAAHETEISQFAGGLRPDSTTVSLDVYLPESVAKIMDDFSAPLMDPGMANTAPTAYNMLRAFDQMQSFFKSNLLLPWTGTWNRNAVSNASIAYLKHGLQFLSPRDNFRNMKEWGSVYFYVIAKTTDMPKLLAPGKQAQVKKWMDATGKTMLESGTGRSMSIEDMVDHMWAKGIMKGQTTAEGLDLLANRNPFPRLRGAISGAAGGAAVGAVAGAVAGPGEGEESSSYASLMGLAAGALLGGRAVGKGGALSKAKLGGLPIASMDGVSGLLQSQFAPAMRAGESATEMPFRVAMFMQEFRETGSLYKAGNVVYQNLNDYMSMSVFERRLMRRMVPFYSWSKLATRQTFLTAIEEPGRLAAIDKTFRDWNEGHGADPEDIPDFFHDRLVLAANEDSPFIGKFVHKGEHGSVVSGFGLPIEDVAEMLKGLPDPEVIATALPFTDQFAASGSNTVHEIAQARQTFLKRGPFGVVSALEAVFNKDGFTNREISSETGISYYQDGDKWAHAPSWLKSLVSYKPATPDSEANVNAHMAWLLGELPVSRFIDLTTRLYEMDDEQRAQMNPYTLSRTLLGPNVYKRDPETNKYFLNQGRIEAMASLLGSVGALKERTYFRDVNPDDSKQGSRSRRGRGYSRGR